MRDLAKAYQTERADLEATDLTGLVVRALMVIAAPFAPTAPSAPFVLGVGDVTNRVNELAAEEELANPDGEKFTNEKRVGKVLTSYCKERSLSLLLLGSPSL